MKIGIRKTENCVVLEFGKVRFYLAVSELEYAFANMLNGNHGGMFSDCGNILVVNADMLAFVESPGSKGNDEGAVEYLRVRMDVAKFVRRVKDLLDRGFIGEDSISLDTASFAFKPVTVPQLTLCEIMRHERFKAQAKMREVLDTVPRPELRKLAQMISRMIFQGKVVVADFCKASFYFYPADGRGYNGGIIFHESSREYSIHT